MKKIKKNDKKTNIEKVKKEKKITLNSFDKFLHERKTLSDSNEPRIVVFGVGGGGSNSVNAIYLNKIKNITTIACNTDSQALNKCSADVKIQLGLKLTKGHGAGADPKIGEMSAKESKAEIIKQLEGAHVAFVIAGMGGGTGTGAAPEISKICLEQGILTIGVVTTPFDFEGEARKVMAENGMKKMQEYCDTLVVLSNEKLKRNNNADITFLNAFTSVDEILCSILSSFIRTISDSSRINIDIADFFTIMKDKKTRAIIGSGCATGNNKAIDAAKDVIEKQLNTVEKVEMKDIDSIIVSVYCGNDSKLEDINNSINYIKNNINPNAQIIFGADVVNGMEDKIEISIFATYKVNENTLLYGIDEEDLIGIPHSFAINEENEEDEYVKNNDSKTPFFSKIINLFIETKK